MFYVKKTKFNGHCICFQHVTGGETAIVNHLTKEEAARALSLIKELPISANVNHNIVLSGKRDNSIICRFLLQLTKEFNKELRSLAFPNWYTDEEWKIAEPSILKYAAMKVEFPEENTKWENQ